jgi:lipopolysaccharide transport system permease protein
LQANSQINTTRVIPGGKSPSLWARGVSDLAEGLTHWQLWWLLALNDIRQRYRRSRLGQFWITLSMAVFIIGIGPLYGSLFSMDLRTFLPHLTVYYVVWSFIAGVLTDSCVTFVQAEPYLRQQSLPKSVFLLRVLTRNLLTLAHNALLIPIVFLFFGVTISASLALVVPGLALLTINCFLAGMFLAVVCTRFRDLPQIVASILQIAFFISPILWHRGALPERLQFVVDYNPFACHLALVGKPLLGQAPTLYEYLICIATSALLCAIALPFFARFRARVVYWI